MVIEEGVVLRKTQMRWIGLLAIAAALIVIGLAKLNVKTISEPAMSPGIDPHEQMMNAKDLPVEHWQWRDHRGVIHPSAH